VGALFTSVAGKRVITCKFPSDEARRFLVEDMNLIRRPSRLGGKESAGSIARTTTLEVSRVRRSKGEPIRR
jgi:hypothetical protein